MKASKFVTVAMLVALAGLAGCGKSDSKSKGGLRCGVNLLCNSNYTGNPSQVIDQNQIIALQTQIAQQFNSQDLSSLRTGQWVAYQKGGYSSSQLRIFGINLGSYNQFSQTCDFYRVESSTAAQVNYRADMNQNCYNYNRSVPAGSIENYVHNDNTELARVLNNYVSNIQTRGIIVNGFNNNQPMIAYSFLLQNGPFGSQYEEIVVVPSLPSFMNPVAVYNQSTGSLKVLYGAQFI